MSGSNSNMTLVTNVATDLDGTDPSLSPYTWTCPDVDPYSAIYFYQFNAAADKSNPAWTTRFTVGMPREWVEPSLTLVLQITSSAGEITIPSQSKQPNGDNVPWGVGVMRSGSPVSSREKHYSSSSSNEPDLDESYSNDGEVTGQQSSNNKTKGGTDYDEETPTTGTGAKKGGGASTGTSSEDPEDLELSEEDEPTSSTKSGSSKSTLKSDEEDSQDSDGMESTSGGTRGDNRALNGSELESPVPTSSRLKTVHSKPTSTPLPVDDINAAATPTLSLPSIAQSAQPVGCTGGINATSSYCSPSNYANHTACASKLDSRAFFMVVFFCWFGLL